MPPTSLILLLLLVAFPLLELALLIKVGSIIGVWLTLAIIASTFFAGIFVVQRQGMGIARRILQTAQTGQPPVVPMMEGMLLMIAGGCLIAPGLITDSIGLVLLVPILRQQAARWIIERGFPIATRSKRRHEHRQHNATPQDVSPSQRRTGPAPTIEGEYERLDERPLNPRTPPSGHHDR